MPLPHSQEPHFPFINPESQVVHSSSPVQDLQLVPQFSHIYRKEDQYCPEKQKPWHVIIPMKAKIMIKFIIFINENFFFNK